MMQMKSTDSHTEGSEKQWGIEIGRADECDDDNLLLLLCDKLINSLLMAVFIHYSSNKLCL
jgi:hypothetical protein